MPLQKLYQSQFIIPRIINQCTQCCNCKYLYISDKTIHILQVYNPLCKFNILQRLIYSNFVLNQSNIQKGLNNNLPDKCHKSSANLTCKRHNNLLNSRLYNSHYFYHKLTLTYMLRIQECPPFQIYITSNCLHIYYRKVHHYQVNIRLCTKLLNSNRK